MLNTGKDNYLIVNDQLSVFKQKRQAVFVCKPGIVVGYFLFMCSTVSSSVL